MEESLPKVDNLQVFLLMRTGKEQSAFVQAWTDSKTREVRYHLHETPNRGTHDRISIESVEGWRPR